MASLIPTSGEILTVNTPSSIPELERLLECSPVACTAGASDGSMWIHSEKNEGVVNPRATDWLNDRGMTGQVKGPVLYLSSPEQLSLSWLTALITRATDENGNPLMAASQVFIGNKAVNTTPSPALANARGRRASPNPPGTVTKNGKPMLPLSGKTFDVKDELKTLGAWWDPAARQWFIPVGKVAEANAIIARGPK